MKCLADGKGVLTKCNAFRGLRHVYSSLSGSVLSASTDIILRLDISSEPKCTLRLRTGSF